MADQGQIGQGAGAPGWYRDEAGGHWFWDGSTWTQPAGPPWVAASGTAGSVVPDRSGETTKGWVLWLATLLGPGWIVALIFYFVDADRRFVRHHASEVLNLAILSTAVSVVGAALVLPGYISLIDVSESGELDTSGLGPAFFLGLAISIASSLFVWIVALVGIFRAKRGLYWRAPLPFRFVRGALGRGEEPPYRLD